MHLSRRIAAPVAIALLAVAACTPGEPQVPAPSPTGSGTVLPEPSSEPTPSSTSPLSEPPSPPAELSRDDEAGAAAAAQYFVALYPYVMRTGDTDEWTAMSAEPCSFCKGIEEDANRIAANGESYTGGEVELSDIRVLARDDLIGGFPIDARFTQQPSMQTDRNGAVLNQTDGDSGVVRIDTLHVNGSWKILALAVRDA